MLVIEIISKIYFRRDIYKSIKIKITYLNSDINLSANYI